MHLQAVDLERPIGIVIRTFLICASWFLMIDMADLGGIGISPEPSGPKSKIGAFSHVMAYPHDTLNVQGLLVTVGQSWVSRS